jgi:hypothetical protein
MKWVFSAFVVLWNLRAIKGRASAGLWSNNVFTKITPGKSPSIQLFNLLCVLGKQILGFEAPTRCLSALVER